VSEHLPSTAELQSEVAAAKLALDQAVADLRAGVAPQAVAQRVLDNAKGWFTDEHGGVRPDRVAIAAGVVVGVIGLRMLSRRHR
jgi:hypothetical protein